MAYKKQKWVEYDETLSEEENVKLGAVVTSDRMNHLEDGIESNETSLKKHTDDNNNPHKVTKAQVGLSNVTDDKQATKSEYDKHTKDEKNPHKVTAAQVGAMTPEDTQKLIMDFLNGKSIEVTIKSDFAGKEAGSEVECPHKLLFSAGTSLLNPNQFTAEVSDVHYRLIDTLDNQSWTISSNGIGVMREILIPFDILSVVKRAYPFLFEGLSESDQVEKLKSIVRRLDIPVWAKGSGPSGNKVTYSIFTRDTSWTGNAVSTSSDITKITFTPNYPATNNFISKNGIIYGLLYADPSDGTTPSSVSLDYTNMEITLKLSMKDFFATATDYQNLENRVRVLENVLTELGGTV